MTKRVGSYTLGINLIALGVLGVINIIFPNAIDVIYIIKFWPAVLISLGIEVLIFNAFCKDGYKYDKLSFLFIGVMMVCSFGAMFIEKYYSLL